MININATDEYRIIVPIRWERFNHGSLARRDSPEIDDRGYFIRRTSAWGAATTRGPMFGVLRGNTVKVRVMREDIDTKERDGVKELGWIWVGAVYGG